MRAAEHQLWQRGVFALFAPRKKELAGLYRGFGRKAAATRRTLKKRGARMEGTPLFLLNTDNRKWKSILAGAFADAHAVKGAVDEDKRDDEENSGENVSQAAALRGGHLHGEFDG